MTGIFLRFRGASTPEEQRQLLAEQVERVLLATGTAEQRAIPQWRAKIKARAYELVGEMK
jgi:hypothetical protein